MKTFPAPFHMVSVPHASSRDRTDHHLKSLIIFYLFDLTSNPSLSGARYHEEGVYTMLIIKFMRVGKQFYVLLVYMISKTMLLSKYQTSCTMHKKRKIWNPYQYKNLFQTIETASNTPRSSQRLRSTTIFDWHSQTTRLILHKFATYLLRYQYLVLQRTGLHLIMENSQSKIW